MAARALQAPETAADSPTGTACHHCGAPLGGGALTATLTGREVRVCGSACRTAVEAIAGAGLDAWYALRTHPDADGAITADSRYRTELDAWTVPEVAETHVRTVLGGQTEVSLTVEGMRCAGCAWLVERLLAATPGVSRATVDFPLRRAEVRFDSSTARLPSLLEALARAGYRAAPFSAHAEEAAIEAERRARLRGLGISALFGMQVMLLSIALYASGASGASGHYGGMDAGFEQLFRWLAMGLTVPVLAWPGRSFFTGAAAALRGRRLTMDVPVALGLSIAFLGSAFATVTGEGAIWFDSVVMFVTLLGGARYLELIARRRSTATIRSLARSAPLVATRVRRRDGEDEGGGTREERVPAAALRPGDRVRVRPGEVIPADGVILSGDSSFDESLLTGESTPVARSAGGRVLGGSANGPGVVEVEVSSAGDETLLGGVLRRAEQAARERPAIALLADRAAAWFIAGVLILAAGVTTFWLVHDASRAVAVLVSVLVVTCPCALSLATPTAMTAALGALARAGLIATRANALERLALATHCLADKTGTLTEGRFRLRTVSTLGTVPRARCLAIAAALERYATHPAATALADAAGALETMDSIEDAGSNAPRTRTMGGRPENGTGRGGVAVEDAMADVGGVTGRIDGVRHAVGSLGFVARACHLPPGEPAGGFTGAAAAAANGTGPDVPPPGAPPRAPVAPDTSGDGDGDGDGDGGSGGHRTRDREGGGTRVFLAREGTLLACFLLADSLRPGARELVKGLRLRGIETTIASGDSAPPVERAGRGLGVARRLHGLTPADKLDEAARLAADGERVLMLGDGVNDTPALAGAHASVAMGRGAAAAASRADAVLIGTDPRALLDGIDIARRTRRIVKQNLAWAVGYNLVALPLAAAGVIPPWTAAIGMSLSSLAVSGNALRLVPRPRRLPR